MALEPPLEALKPRRMALEPPPPHGLGTAPFAPKHNALPFALKHGAPPLVSPLEAATRADRLRLKHLSRRALPLLPAPVHRAPMAASCRPPPTRVNPPPLEEQAWETLWGPLLPPTHGPSKSAHEGRPNSFR